MNRAFVPVCFCVFLISSPHTVSAQDSEAVGSRAQGMGGAFTAVADDSTATWWNPAGLAAGAFFNLILETSSVHQPADSDRVPAWRGTSRGFSIAYPALGLSYYRLRVSETRPAGSTDADAGGRQHTGAEIVRLRTVVVNQFGATVGQSLGQHLVLASTVKLVRAGAGTDVRTRGTASLDSAEELEASVETHTGLDVGAMARFSAVSLGLTVRNATEPTFGEGDAAFALTRRFRAGIALSSRGTGGMITVDADFDLTRIERTFGAERRAAVGVELWTASRRIGLRGGVSGNTVGTLRPAPSGGASVALRPGIYVDAHVTGGTDEAGRGWGSALRVTF
jgi:hypothetical protein